MINSGGGEGVNFFLKKLWLKQIAVKISVSSIASQQNHMEKYYKSTTSIFRLSILFLSKPASLLCFVDPSLCASSRVKAVHRYQIRSTYGRSTG